MKDIRKIRWLFVVTLLVVILGACSDSTSHSLSIVNIECEGTMCYLKLDVSSPGRDLPSVLVTVGRSPLDGNDGMKFKGSEISFELKEHGTHSIYVTLIEGKRFLTTPAYAKATVNLQPPNAPVFRWNLAHGEVTLTLETETNGSVTDYLILVNDTEYGSSDGVFTFPIERDNEYIVQAFSRSGSITSKPSVIDLRLSEDFPPVVDLSIGQPYLGGSLGAAISDDWDSVADLSIRAYIEESGIPLLFDGTKLIPEIPLPEGQNTLVVQVIDSSGNKTECRRQIQVIRKTSVDLPELYIEEGTIRNARWSASEGPVELQRYRDGEWITLSTHMPNERSSVITKESISENGDLYRIVFESDRERFMPSVPVFAKESLFRRFSTEVISSFLGMDALLVGGNDYRFYGNIVVRDGSVMRAESGSSLTIPKGNTLLVSGVLDLEGRKDRISVNPGGSTGTIEVANNGVLIARSVDFNNTRILVKEAAVVVFENCTFSRGLEIEGARTVQIYGSNVKGEVVVENVREMLVHISDFSGTEVTFSNLGMAMLSRSDMKSQTLRVINSRIEVVDSLIESKSVLVNKTSRFSFIGGPLIDTVIEVSGASSLHIDEPQIIGSVTIDIKELSRLSVQKKVEGLLEILSDEKSAIKVF